MRHTIRHLVPLALLGAAAITPALAERPTPIAAALADRGRSEAHRKLDAERMPAEVLAFAGVRPDQVVVDFFAGEGYYSELLADLVGPRGTVYLTNPPSFHDPKVVDPLLARHPNVRTLVAPVAAMQFAPGSVDILFTHLNYHDLYWQSEKFKYPRVEVPAVLTDWFRAVKPGGHVVIVDHWGPPGDPRQVADKLHRIDPERVKADMTAAGFVLVGEGIVLRRSEDDHTKLVFDPSVRGKSDRFMLKFQRP